MAVRRESVELNLVDNFTAGMIRAAAATKALNKEVNSLDGQNVRTTRSSKGLNDPVERLSVSAVKADRGINQLTGRLRLFADVAAVLGPALVPLGGVALAGVAGLASQFGFAAAGAGVALVAFQGVGDALKAVNTAALEPTQANLDKARVALEAISPAAQGFVQQLHEMMPALKAVRDAGSEAMFPGLTESLDNLEDVLPRVSAIMESIGGAIGSIGADSSASLASDRWAPFLDFIADEAPKALTDLSSIVGDLTHGMAELWMAFTPLNDGFSSWLVDVADGFDRWAQGLSQTDGFAEFVDYIQSTGPQVADTLGAFADAMIQIAQAAAPIGGPVLAALEAVAKTVAVIADSPIGSVLIAGAAGMAVLTRATAVWAVVSKTSVAQFATGQKTVQSSIAATQGKFTGLGTSMRGALGGTAALAGITLGITLLAGAAKAADDFSEALARIDDALMSGNVKELDAEIGSVQARLEDLSTTSGIGDFFADFYKQSPTGEVSRLKEELDELIVKRDRLANTSIDPNALNLGGLLGQPLQLGKEFDVASQSATEFKNSMLSLNDALAGRSSWRDYEAAIDAVSDSLKENGRTLDITTAKGRANQAALDTIASTSIGVSESLKGMDRVRFLQRARQDFINAAVDLGRTRKGARDLADDLGLLNTKRAKPEIDADDTKAKRKIHDVDALMDAMNGRTAKPKVDGDDSPFKAMYRDVNAMLAALDGKTATTYIRTVTTGGKGPQPATDTGRADGGTIPGPRHPYGDKILMWGAPGEEVVTNRNGEADRFRADRAAGRIPAYAGGGTVGNADERLAVLQAEQRIRDILKELAKDGKDKLSKNAREIAKAELEAAKVNLKAAQTAVGGTARDKATEAADARAADEQRRAEGLRENAERGAAAEQKRKDAEADRFKAILDGQEKAANDFISAAEEQKSAAVTIRDSIKQNMDRLGEAATSGFRSGLFEQQSGNLWAGGGAGWKNALGKDIAGLSERSGIISQLSAAGITGTALDALLSQGSNKDLQGLIKSGGTGEFAAMFAQREALQGSVGQQAGMAAYGREYGASVVAVGRVESQLVLLRQELAAINGMRPITVNEAVSATATAREVARLQALLVT